MEKIMPCIYFQFYLIFSTIQALESAKPAKKCAMNGSNGTTNIQ